MFIFIILWKFIRSCCYQYELKRFLICPNLEAGHLGFLTIFVGENYTKFKGFLLCVSYLNVCLMMGRYMYSRIQMTFQIVDSVCFHNFDEKENALFV